MESWQPLLIANMPDFNDEMVTTAVEWMENVKK